jgi:arylsulfatase A-like enzyme
MIKAGTESAALMAHLDMPATFAALVGSKIPAGHCSDSINVLPALLGETKTSARKDFVAHVGGTEGPLGLRDGQWKYISPGKAAGLPQLYNLANDLAEEKNLATSEPEKLKEMQALLAKARGQ